MTFEVPEGEDWWHMYAYVDGQSLFDPYAIRGKTDLDNIAVPSESGIIEVVLEDYSGNMSEPVLIPYGQDELTNDPDETVFPDPVLLEAVRTQIGTTKRLSITLTVHWIFPIWISRIIQAWNISKRIPSI